eukprot:scaffold22890_cov75-Phaeocystis_antarctica.AAC.3
MSSRVAPASFTSTRAVRSPRPPRPPVKRWAPLSPPARVALSVLLAVPPTCAIITAWACRKPAPRMQTVWWKRLSSINPRHCSHSISGLWYPKRSGSADSWKSHHPSVSPNVIWASALVRCASLISSSPPGASSWRQFRSVLRMNGVACRVLVVIMRSYCAEAKPCSRGSASMLSNSYSTNGYSAAKVPRAPRRKLSDTSVKV